MSLTSSSTVDAIVVGAGAAGLAAADRLREGGASCVVLEARGAVGGRIRTEHLDGEVADVGARYLHGSHSTSWHYVRRAGLKVKLVDELSPSVKALDYFCHGAVVAPLVRGTGTALLDTMGIEGPVRVQLEAFFRNTGLDPSVLGGIEAILEYRAFAAERDRDYALIEGFQVLANAIAESSGADIVLGARVVAVRYDASGVVVTADHGERLVEHRGTRLVLTLPVGVLQAGGVRFEPPLPPWKVESIEAFLNADHVVAHANLDAEVDVPDQSVLDEGRVRLTRQGARRWMISGVCEGARVVAGGPRVVGKLLSETWRRPVGVEAWVSHDFFTDPLSLGSYCGLPPGRERERARLATPVANRLFFAGEATARPGAKTTVHGAIETGWVAADQVLGA